VSRGVTELRRSPAARRIEVVLADDDGGFVESLRTMVDEQPTLSVVGVAGDGLEAIELVEELRPEAVVIDLHMPRLDGVSAVARMRQDHPSLCLIAVTGDGEPELHRAVEEAGADAVLMKDDDLFDALPDRIFAARAAAS
jgi:two-component system, chemotaxis family, protein-glutamate methylesterase/glutaminase